MRPPANISDPGGSGDSFLDDIARACRPLIAPAGSVLVAVSGGADSTALLHALARLRGGLRLSRLGVAHVNHGLRGAESDGDEAFVRDVAAASAAQFHAVRLGGVSLHDPGMEAWAREARYRFFADVKQCEAYDAVATAHTADDQAETLIMRLWRGAGIRGLAGIRERRDDGVVRPMLGVTRRSIEVWLAAEGLSFRHDSSNDDVRLRRNWIRLRLLPMLREREPRIVEVLASCAANFAAVGELLAPLAEAWRGAYVFEDGSDRIILRKPGFQEPALASYVVMDLLAAHGCQATREHAAAVLSCGARSEGVFLMPGGWRCEAERDTVTLTPGPASASNAGPCTFSVDLAIPGTTRLPDDRGEIAAEYIDLSRGPQSFDSSNLTVILDAGIIAGPLRYRSGTADDTFQPLGSTGPHSLGNYLKNQKISRDKRNRIGVVALDSGPIVWIPGVQISHAYRRTEGTVRGLRLGIQCRATI